MVVGDAGGRFLPPVVPVQTKRRDAGADVSRVGIFSEICIRLIMSVTLSLMSSCGRAVGKTTGVRGVNKVDWQRRENTSELALSKRGIEFAMQIWYNLTSAGGEMTKHVKQLLVSSAEHSRESTFRGQKKVSNKTGALSLTVALHQGWLWYGLVVSRHGLLSGLLPLLRGFTVSEDPLATARRAEKDNISISRVKNFTEWTDLEKRERKGGKRREKRGGEEGEGGREKEGLWEFQAQISDEIF